MNKPSVIAIVGPTASGKSQLGIDLLDFIEGEIVSADSMQIYQKMDIGTAKPSLETRSTYPHHLIDIIDPKQTYNVGQFVMDADQAIKRIIAKKKIPIILGGTWLYVKALLQGIIEVSDINIKTKQEIKILYQTKGLSACYQLLLEKDPIVAKRLHPNDTTRVLRALEVILDKKVSINELQKKHSFSEYKYHTLFIGIHWERDILYKRINQRVLTMIEQGLIKEVENLLNAGYNSNLPAMNSIGYKQVVKYLNGNISLLDTMIQDIQQKSRKYAKKQITWGKKQKNIVWLQPNYDPQKIYQNITDFFNHD